MTKLTSKSVPKKDAYTREERRAYHLAYYNKRKQKLVDMLGGRCVECGTKKLLEFDHEDPNTKSFSIGKAILSMKWDLVVAEAHKCKLRCRKCHLERTTALGHVHRCKHKSGAESVNAKLSEKEVREIRRVMHKEKTSALAKQYCVSRACIWFLKHGITYSNVT